MELAAEALDIAGMTRADAVAYRDLLRGIFPRSSSEARSRRIQYALLTPFAVHGGLEPDLLEEVTYWIEQYWQYALFEVVAVVREGAERSGTPIETLVAELAKRSTIEIG